MCPAYITYLGDCAPWRCILLVSKHIVGTGPLYHFTEKEEHYQLNRNF